MSEQATAPDSGSGALTVDTAADAFLGMMNDAEAPEESGEQEAQDTAPEASEASEPEGDYEDNETSDEPVPQRFRVKAAGEEKEVTLDELVDGYQKGADYTKKAQQLAEQRKAVEAERTAVDQAKRERDAYAQRLQMLDQILSSQTKTEDLEALKETDPIGYAVKVAEQAQRDKQLAAVRAEQQRIALQQRAEQQARLKQIVSEQAQRLAESIPGYADPEKGQAVRGELRKYAIDNGFSEQEVAQAYDARAINLMWKAMQYDRLQRNKPQVTKRVQEAPQMLRPGVSAQQRNAGDEAIKKARAQLKKSGSVADAAALFEKFI